MLSSSYLISSLLFHRFFFVDHQFSSFCCFHRCFLFLTFLQFYLYLFLIKFQILTLILLTGVFKVIKTTRFPLSNYNNKLRNFKWCHLLLKVRTLIMTSLIKIRFAHFYLIYKINKLMPKSQFNY